MERGERAKALTRFADGIDDRLDALFRLETRNNGRPLRETRAQVGRLSEWFRYNAALLLAERTDVVPMPGAVPQLPGAPPARRLRAADAVQPPADDPRQEPRAGAGQRQHRRHQALGADAADHARARRDRGRRRHPGRRASTSSPGSAPRRARRSPSIPAWRGSPSPAAPRWGARSASPPRAASRAPPPSSAARRRARVRRRRRRARRGGRRVRRLHRRRADLHLRLARARPGLDLRRRRSPVWRAAREDIRVGDPADEGTQMGPLISARQRERVLGYVESGEGAGSSPAAASRDSRRRSTAASSSSRP